MFQREWANAHSLRSIELEPLRKGSPLIYLYHISQPILMSRFGNLLLEGSMSPSPKE